MFYGTYCGVFVLVGFVSFELVLVINVDFRCPEGILGTILVDLGFSGLRYFY